VLFLMPMAGVAMQGQTTSSWLLTNTLGNSLTHGVGVVLWAAVIVGYLAGLAGTFTHAAWWQPVLVAASAPARLGCAYPPCSCQAPRKTPKNVIFVTVCASPPR